MSPKLKIGLLVVGHVVVGLLLGWGTWRETARTPVFTSSPIAMFSLFALVFSEAGLIGIWGALSSTRLTWRIPATCSAIVFVGGIQVTAMRLAEKSTLFLIIALTSSTILLVLSGLRFSRRKLRLANLANEPMASEGFQFSIRQVLFATAAVAVVLGIRRIVSTIPWPWENTVEVAIFPACLTIVELATLWAALGIGRPTLRLAVVLPTAIVVGLIPPFYTAMLVRGNLDYFVASSAAIGLQAVITAGSLLVIRSSGWRLVSGDRNEVESLPTPTAS